MAETAPASVLVELAAAVDEYGRHQRELISLVRRLQAARVESPAAVVNLVQLPPPPPRGAVLAFSGAAWKVEVLGSSVHATTRDYDYFAELDRRLAFLNSPPPGS